MLQAQLAGAAIDGVGLLYFEGFIFKAVPVALVSEQQPTLLLSLPARIEIVLLVKKKKNQLKLNSLLLVAETEGELSTPALFSGWEPFLFSLEAVSAGEKKDVKGK